MSAFSSAHVFGPAHSAALEELREAQIALAKAWGRGEQDEENLAEDLGVGQGKGREEGRRDAEGEESKEEHDIIEARRRREANERFFNRVSKGVVDVVGRLDEVASAMAKVERESREIWNGINSADSASIATSQ